MDGRTNDNDHEKGDDDNDDDDDDNNEDDDDNDDEDFHASIMWLIMHTWDVYEKRV